MARFTMGLDAEFALQDNRGQLVEARNYLPGTEAVFGTDGCSTIGEVRPRPGDTPVELVANLKAAMQRGVTRHVRMNRLKMVANGYRHGFALGAHIHIGHPEFRVNGGYATDTQRRRQGEVAKAFDSLVLPFATLFGERSNEQLRRRSYGMPGDIRTQPHGFEYRSCSSFIASPAVTLGVLTVAHVVMNEYLEGRLVVEHPLHTDAFVRNPHTESSRNLDAKMRWLINTRTVQDCKLHKEVLAVLFQMVNNGNYEQVDDMKKSWKLRFTEPEGVRPMTPARALAFTEVR